MRSKNKNDRGTKSTPNVEHLHQVERLFFGISNHGNTWIAGRRCLALARVSPICMRLKSGPPLCSMGIKGPHIKLPKN